MTCSIFTIVKSYFTCCAAKKNEKDADSDTFAGPGSGDSSPFSFDDLTSDTNSNITNSWSSTSTLEDYYIPPTQHSNIHRNYKQIQQQKLVKRYYAEVFGIQ
jgi:hypothetical protein